MLQAMTVLGERLMAARKRRGWEPKDLEDHSGVPANYITQIERGRIRERPDPRRVYLLAQAVGEDWREWFVTAEFLPPDAFEEAFGPAANLEAILLRSGMHPDRVRDVLVITRWMGRDKYGEQ